MADRLEKTIVKNIIRDLNALPGARAVKTWQGGAAARAGTPDIDAVVQGRALKVEVKRPSTRGAVTAQQERELAKWKASGALTGVVCSEDEMSDLLHQHGWLGDRWERP
jgi:hypothetical protein